MDMALRSFVVAGILALVLAAGGAAWWLTTQFGGSAPADPAGSDRISITDGYDDREGSLYDEFGGDRVGEGDNRITITTGEDLFSDDIFDRRDRSTRPSDRADRFGSGPRFDWSGGGNDTSGARDTAPLPRDTAADRVEADCRVRGGGSYACRCLVRLARRDLSEAEFEFLSLAEEREPRAERLQSAGVAFTALGELSGRLLTLDAAASRRCGTGLTR